MCPLLLARCWRCQRRPGRWPVCQLEAGGWWQAGHSTATQQAGAGHKQHWHGALSMNFQVHVPRSCKTSGRSRGVVCQGHCSSRVLQVLPSCAHMGHCFNCAAGQTLTCSGGIIHQRSCGCAAVGRQWHPGLLRCCPGVDGTSVINGGLLGIPAGQEAASQQDAHCCSTEHNPSGPTPWRRLRRLHWCG